MSMTSEQMLHFMQHPEQLDGRTIAELKEIVEEFPYFQTAHLLYVKNLQNEKNFRFADQLKICAAHVTDRTILFKLINDHKIKASVQSAHNISYDSMNSDYSEENKQTRSGTDTVYRLEGEFDLEKSLAQLVNEINQTAKKHRNDLTAKQETGDKDLMIRSISNDEFITETLARIYIKQGLYEKAIDAFKRLAIKFPEKSIYFAKQIKEVTNLLNK